jgi:Domain of unknown function (DUF4326)
MPQRIQRQRTRGWRMPAHTVYVGRPTPWGNPFVVGKDVATAAEAVARYRQWLVDTAAGQALAARARRELGGKDVACWCRLDQPCHGDVLLALANAT